MAKRTGASLLHTINDAPTALMVTVGFSPEQASRMIQVRKVLPLVENPKEPQIDARSLWKRIGEPHKRFNDWAAHYIAPLLARPSPFKEISVKVTKGAKGRPRQDYDLSRDLAAQLAMQANTPEGEEIRSYFLDMERLALRLSEHLGIRVTAIIATDNKVIHTITKRTAEDAKSGKFSKAEVKAISLKRIRLLLTTVCETLTGHTPKYWRTTFKRGIRDVLDTPDAQLYSQCFETAWALTNAGMRSRDELVPILKASYGGKVSPAKYAHKAIKPL